VTRLLTLLIVAGALLALSWFMLPVWAVGVTGSGHLDPKDIARQAGATPGSPWLWVTDFRAAELARNPWVAGVRVTKTFPGRVNIEVAERKPAAVHRPWKGERAVLAADGTALPGAPLPTLAVRTWGGSCTVTSQRAANCFQEALQVARLLPDLKVSEVRVSPAGFTLLGQDVIVWTDAYASLRKHGAGVRMVASVSAPARKASAMGASDQERTRVRVNVYPWGVSVQE
jgi:cell division protein FtsQ